MLDRIGQRLLHDPVRRELDAGADRGHLVEQIRTQDAAGVPCPVDEPGDVGETGARWLRACLELIGLEQSEHPAHVAQGLACGRLDRVESCAHLGQAAVDAAPSGLDLDHDRRRFPVTDSGIVVGPAGYFQAGARHHAAAARRPAVRTGRGRLEIVA